MDGTCSPFVKPTHLKDHATSNLWHLSVISAHADRPAGGHTYHTLYILYYTNLYYTIYIYIYSCMHICIDIFIFMHIYEYIYMHINMCIYNIISYEYIYRWIDG